MSNVKIFDGPYAETITILENVRHYLLYEEWYDRQRVDKKSAHIINIELMDIIARLSHVLSWLIAQKAVHAGEMSDLPWNFHPAMGRVPTKVTPSGAG
ncbi:DUF1465 family protein [Paramagnetospirillum kuznetsovii]|uniref:DUF1465 family protein n=1 Tax=Paramagnetospirillum kuznetsovii TaxID=2053833 RepID=UPI000DD3CD4F|nr:DUF1465 family protein [Paramagnetospirillum kuznetsovii]